MAKGKNGNNEGSIRKRKNGTWEGRYTIGYDARGRQKQLSVYGKTRAEVARKLNEKTAAIQNGTYIIPRDHTDNLRLHKGSGKHLRKLSGIYQQPYRALYRRCKAAKADNRAAAIVF